MTNKEFILEKTKNGREYFHFIGIGGIGMSALALCLIDKGFNISGSDLCSNNNIEKLISKGARINIGHKAENIVNVGLIIASSAIKENNPELLEAKRQNIPVIHRSQLLEALMDGLARDEKPISIGVSGTHGKTTTSGMLGLVFELAGLEPSIAVGGMIPSLNTNSKFSDGKYFISELDESDGTISIYKPDYTVITNLEKDHVDHYEDGLSQVLATFEGFLKRLNDNAKVVVNIDDSGVQKLLSNVNLNNMITYSIKPDSNADFTAKNIFSDGFSTSAEIYRKGQHLGDIELVVPGIHNISNSLAVIAVALDCGIAFETIKNSLKQFTGMKRRFQTIFNENNIRIVDDYAHHPTEIKATLNSALTIKKKGLANRIVAVFQPHRYTRFHGLWEDFKTCFENADEVFVIDVYPAGEAPIEGFLSQDFCTQTGFKYLDGNIEYAVSKLLPLLNEGDLVIGLGAGSINMFTKILAENLREKECLKS